MSIGSEVLRLCVLFVFLIAASGIEWALRGSSATRWKDSLLLVAALMSGGVLGGATLSATADSVPAWWTPSEHSARSPWSQGFGTGSLVGFACSGLIVLAHRLRPSWPRSRVMQILRDHQAPLCAALLILAITSLLPVALWSWLDEHGAPGRPAEIRIRALAGLASLGAGITAAWTAVRSFCRRRALAREQDPLGRVAAPFAHREPHFAHALSIGWRLLVLLTLPVCCIPGATQAVFCDTRSEVAEALPDRARAHYEALKTHLEEPFDGYGTLDVFTKPFGVVLLSHAACGLVNVGLADSKCHAETSPLFDELVARALSQEVSPYRRPLDETRFFGDQNLYLSHLAVILGARRWAGGDERFDPLHARIVHHLVERSLHSVDAHAPSFPGSPCFPADQAVTAFAVHLFDRLQGTTLSTPLIEGWRRVAQAQVHPPTKLPRSCLDPDYPGSQLPRGCALSWSCLYAAQFDPELATQLYRRYREQFFAQPFGLGGFREYPHGEFETMDLDSGPVLLGLGMAASGIGLGAARLFGDSTAYAAILRSGAVIGLPPLFDPSRYLLAPQLGETILLHGLTARPWFGTVESVSFDDSPGAPVAALRAAGAPRPRRVPDDPRIWFESLAEPAVWDDKNHPCSSVDSAYRDPCFITSASLTERPSCRDALVRGLHERVDLDRLRRGNRRNASPEEDGDRLHEPSVAAEAPARCHSLSSRTPSHRSLAYPREGRGRSRCARPARRR